MQMRINGTPVTVAWENNDSVPALKKLATNGLTIQMSMYSKKLISRICELPLEKVQELAKQKDA